MKERKEQQKDQKGTLRAIQHIQQVRFLFSVKVDKVVSNRHTVSDNVFALHCMRFYAEVFGITWHLDAD